VDFDILSVRSYPVNWPTIAHKLQQESAHAVNRYCIKSCESEMKCVLRRHSV